MASSLSPTVQKYHFETEGDDDLGKSFSFAFKKVLCSDYTVLKMILLRTVLQKRWKYVRVVCTQALKVVV